ncbi:MAG: adenine-specific methyltransferase EcoRI family protein, partial [Spirochaetaceae bacterium]|nr:adenine-specific methyltransferase EcoRI family protein [Spirochaetaceae bacterium]
MANKDLQNAKRQKNDEFYTQLTDIEKELIHYREHFRGK